MKKGLCIVLSALMVALSFSACSKKGGDLADAETKTNKDGQVYVEVTDKDGKEVTDASGEVVTSVLSFKEVEEKEKADKAKEKAENATNDNNGKNDVKVEDKKENNKKEDNKKTTTIGINPDVSKAFNEDSFLDITAADKDLYKEGTTIKKTTLFKSKVQDVIKTGKFTIDMNTVSGNQKSPMKIAFDGDKMYAAFNTNGVDMRMVYMDKTAYIILPNVLTVKNVYFKYPDANGEFSEIFSAFGQISDNGASYVGSSKVKVGTKTYTCEEYKTDDGTVMKYYFDGNDWKRYECIGEDEKMVYEINTFSGNVDSKLFSLKGYTELDPNLLGSMGM